MIGLFRCSSCWACCPLSVTYSWYAAAAALQADPSAYSCIRIMCVVYYVGDGCVSLRSSALLQPATQGQPEGTPNADATHWNLPMLGSLLLPLQSATAAAMHPKREDSCICAGMGRERGKVGFIIASHPQLGQCHGNTCRTTWIAHYRQTKEPSDFALGAASLCKPVPEGREGPGATSHHGGRG